MCPTRTPPLPGHSDYALTARQGRRVVYVVPVYVVRGTASWANGYTDSFSALLSAIDPDWLEGRD